MTATTAEFEYLPVQMSPRSRRRRIVHVIDVLIWSVASIVSVIIAGIVVLYGVQFSRVLSPSMTPAMPVGSVAVTSHVPIDQLRVGQVAILHTPSDHAPYIHRIISMNYTPRGLEVRTKGDANPVADPWTVLVTGPEIPVLVFVLPTVQVTNIAMHLQFIAVPLFLLGIVATIYFGLAAMRRPDEDSAHNAQAERD